MKHSISILVALTLIFVSSSAQAQRVPPGGGQNRSSEDSHSEPAPVHQREPENEPASHVTYDPVIGKGDAVGSGEVEESKGVVSEQERMADGESMPPKTKQVAASKSLPSKTKSTTAKKSKSAKLKKLKPAAKTAVVKPAAKAHSKSAKKSAKKKKTQ